jgi:hypothetical protein
MRSLLISVAVSLICASANAQIFSTKCCNCLTETNIYDLSTGQQATDPYWVTAGSSAYAPTPSSQWRALPPAHWIQYSSFPTDTYGATTFPYRLQFTIPECIAPMSARLDGKFAADNAATLSIDGQQIASCAGPNCFSSTSTQAPVPFSVTGLSPGLHTITVIVTNMLAAGQNTISGLIVSAQLTTRCAACNQCPVIGHYDGANCFISHAPAGTTGFLSDNAFYYHPLPVHQCPLSGSWFDGAECFVMAVPPNTLPFVWNNGFYVKNACRTAFNPATTTADRR